MNPISQLMLAGAFAAGMVLSLAGSMAWDRLVDDPAVKRVARAEGILSERQAWEEARRRAEILKAQKLAEAQAKISAAEKTVLDWQINDRRRVESFRAALEEQALEDKAQHTDRSACALPDRVWNALR